MEIFQVQQDMVYAMAKVCHQANQAFRSALGQDPGPSWNQCSPEQQAVTMSGVQAILADPRMGPADLHQNWVDDMTANGWVHGPVKDYNLRTHPCLLPFHELPAHERYKDKLFSGIVHALMEQAPTTNEETHPDVVDVP